MANTPTYSLRGTRINFNELRAQSRRSEVEPPKKPSKKTQEKSVADQKLLGGFTPAPVVDNPPAPEPKKAAVAPAPQPAPTRPILTAPTQSVKKPTENDAEVDE